MKELSIERMEVVKGGCNLAGDLAVGFFTGAAGALIGIASGGLGFAVALAAGSFYSIGCHLARK